MRNSSTPAEPGSRRGSSNTNWPCRDATRAHSRIASTCSRQSSITKTSSSIAAIPGKSLRFPRHSGILLERIPNASSSAANPVAPPWMICPSTLTRLPAIPRTPGAIFSHFDDPPTPSTCRCMPLGSVTERSVSHSPTTPNTGETKTCFVCTVTWSVTVAGVRLIVSASRSAKTGSIPCHAIPASSSAGANTGTITSSFLSFKPNHSTTPLSAQTIEIVRGNAEFLYFLYFARSYCANLANCHACPRTHTA